MSAGLILYPVTGIIIHFIQLLKLNSSADWSKVHHVGKGILCKDR